MGDKTSIEWTDATWNPTRGCRRKSPGCLNCYAEVIAARFSGEGLAYEGLAEMTPSGPRWTGKARFVGEHLADPLRWQRPRRIFVDSTSDLFFEAFTNEQIAAVFGVMAAARQHTFQVLTKRPERAVEWFKWAERADIAKHAIEALRGYVETGCGSAFDPDAWPLPNVWLGVSVEDQRRADERIPLLLQAPGAVRFLSMEPLLGQVDLSEWMAPMSTCGSCNAVHAGEPDVCPSCGRDDLITTWGAQEHEDLLSGARYAPSPEELRAGVWSDGILTRPQIDWVICGGESGHGARPMHPAWARSLRDQCAEAGVPFLFKQWGEWAPVLTKEEAESNERRGLAERMTGRTRWLNTAGGHGYHGDDVTLVRRVGKKAAGRELDGRTHDAFPEVTRG